MITLGGIEQSIVSLIFSKAAGWIVAAVATHLVIVRMKVDAAIAKVKAEVVSKFDEAVEYIKSEAEQDEVVVKATIEKVVADVRKIF